MGNNTNPFIIELTYEVIEEFESRRQLNGPEDAGVLLGSIIDNNHIRINRMSSSCAAKRTISGCVIDATLANRYIQEEFESSCHTRVFIGEWHTHPEDHPSPSTIDINTIAKDYRECHPSIDGLVMIIIGRRSIYYGVYTENRLCEFLPILV